MKKSDWLKQVAVLQLRWPNPPIKPETAELWFMDLEEFDVEQVEASIVALYRDGREFAPNGAQIRNKLLELRTDAPDFGAAYKLTMEAAGPGGGFNNGLSWLREQSPMAADAAERYGWREFCLEDTPDGTRRAQYRDIFLSLARRAERDERYVGIESAGLRGLPSAGKTGPKKLRQIIQLPKGEAA